jgi:head-tail adaptor
MRAGNQINRITFYGKTTVRDVFGASSDSWTTATINTRGEVRYSGGNKTLSNEEKFYSKSIELLVRYQSSIIETMKVQIDGTNDLYVITYIEIIGRKEGLRLTLEKQNDGLSNVIIEPPTLLVATLDGIDFQTINLSWSNNLAGDAISIERSLDGNVWAEIDRTATGVTSFKNSDLAEDTKYYYRVRHFLYYDYSAYSNVDSETTTQIDYWAVLIGTGSPHREEVRDGIYYVDIALTPTGFDGDEGTDWEVFMGITIDGLGVYREEVRAGCWCVDETLTPTGFDGDEDIDWGNAFQNVIE